MEKIKNIGDLLYNGECERAAFEITEKLKLGKVNYIEHTPAQRGWFVHGHDISVGGDFEFEADGVEKRASLIYYRGAGYVIRVVTHGAGCEYYMIRPAKIRHPSAEKLAVMEFEKVVDDLIR